MQSSSEQPLVGEEHCVTTLITAAKETMATSATTKCSLLPSASTVFNMAALGASHVARRFILFSPHTYVSHFCIFLCHSRPENDVK